MLTITLTFVLGTLGLLLGAYIWFSLPRRLAESAPQRLRTIKEDKYRQLFSQYLGGIAIVIGLIAGFLQNQATISNFERDFSARTAHDSRTEFYTAIEQLKGPNPAIRTAAIYTMSELLRRDLTMRDAVLLSLVAFVREARSIDSHPQVVDALVPLDVQAAIRVIGSRNQGRDSSKDHGNTSDDRIALDFSRLALAGASFRDGDFDKATFQQSNLRGTSFAKASLREANFIEADFDYRCLAVVLDGSYDSTKINPDRYWDAPLWWRQQVQATFAGAVAAKANFNHALLVGVTFDHADVRDAQFEDANITYADYSDALYAPDDLRLSHWTADPHPVSIAAGVPTPKYSGRGDCGANRWNLPNRPASPKS